jgi:hypothetical protein
MRAGASAPAMADDYIGAPSAYARRAFGEGPISCQGARRPSAIIVRVAARPSRAARRAGDFSGSCR